MIIEITKMSKNLAMSFTNEEIDSIIDILKQLSNRDACYIYALYDDSYENRPANPTSPMFGIAFNEDEDDDAYYNNLLEYVKQINENYKNYCAKWGYCEGIGHTLTITKRRQK